MEKRFSTFLIFLIGFTSISLSGKCNVSFEQDSTKGQILLQLSLPYINNFYLKPLDEGTKNNSGFIGYSIGIDYYYKSNHYVNFSFSQIQDFFIPIVFVDRGDEYERMGSSIFSLTNNHIVNRLTIGYGFVFSKNSWELRNILWDKNSSTREPVKKDNNAIGFSLSTYYHFYQCGYLGIIYRPTFLRLNVNPTFKYEQLS